MTQNDLPERVYYSSNGLEYVLSGDHYLPVIDLPVEHHPIGKWGRMHKRFLEKHRPALYSQMILNGTLYSHLAEIDETANRRLNQIISEVAAAEGVDEKMKAANQLGWVQRMNGIRQRAEEIVMSEIIFC